MPGQSLNTQIHWHLADSASPAVATSAWTGQSFNTQIHWQLADSSSRCCSKYCMDWAVNFATQRPDGSGLLAVVGDDPATLLLDSKPGNRLHMLEGHLDYSFAAAWHPSGTLLATGNQVRPNTAQACWAVRAACRMMAAASPQYL